VEKYVNNPRQMAEVEQIRAGNLIKENPEFYELKHGSNEFELLRYHQPKRRLEFNLANYFYLADAAKYLCTHFREKLNLGSINYIETVLDWEIFLQITIGKFHDQYHKFMDELRDAQRYCYIPKEDGGYYIMPAFRLDFATENQEDLSADQLRKLKNIEAQKIKTVTFSMAKPIFEKYLNLTDKQYYRHPPNLYANLYDITSKKLFVPEDDLTDCPDLAAPTFVAGYIRFFDYLYLHGAGTNDRISLNFQDMITHVMPSLIQTSKQGKTVARDVKKLAKFLSTATVLSAMLHGLDYKLKSPPIDDPNKDGYMIYEFDHPHKIQTKSKTNYIKDSKR
jgi:hypothetical protein